MGVNAKSYRGRKVILLSRDAGLARCADGDEFQSLRVTSPYEAAAELFEDHPAALVIDLRCLTPGDLPLIETARRLGVEVLVVGAVPLGVTTADLSGARLARREHLAALLAAAVAEIPSDESADVSDSASMSRWVGAAPRPESSGRAAIPVKDSDRSSESQAADASGGDSPGDLLTSEELTALLEDE